MAKGYNPYNNVGSKAKPKRPAWKKPSPNNPYNNAGPKVKASSNGITSYKQITDKYGRTTDSGAAKFSGSNVEKAGKREFSRVNAMRPEGRRMPTNGRPGSAGNYSGPAGGRAARAEEGMMRKNAVKKATVDKARAARPSKIGWAKAGGAKARGSAVKWGTGTANKAVVAVDNTLKKAGYRGIKDAMGALKSFEKAGNKVAAGALKDVATRAAASGAGRFAAGVALGTAAAANVLSAGAAGYAIGTGIYNKNATKIQDTLDKYVRNRRKK